MRRYLRYIFFLFSLTCYANGQSVSEVPSTEKATIEEFWFEPDRPGAGTGTGVVPFKKVMLEVGEQFDISRRDLDVMLPEVQLRAGITRFAELRFSVGGNAEHEGRWNFDIDPLVLGTKVRFSNGYKWLPEIALLAELAIPCTPQQASSMTVAPSLHLLFENEVNRWFKIDYDVGAEWDGRDMKPDVFISLSGVFCFAKRWQAYLESFNYITGFGKHFDGIPCLSAGIYCQVHQRVQVDLYGCFNAMDPDLYSNFGVGIAWLIN